MTDVDKREFERLLAGCASDAVSFARMLARNDAVGDDVYQDAVLSAFQAFGALADHSKFRGWLFRIIINSRRTEWRRSLWRRALSFEIEIEAPRATPEPWIRQALQRLPPPQREALLLHEAFEYTVEEVAQTQGVSTSAVKSRLVRARESMKKHYDNRNLRAATTTLGAHP